MTDRSIPFFPYSELFCQDEDALMDLMADVCRRGAYILQDECFEFERNLASFIGVKHAIGVANGTDAIIIGLKAEGIGAGDEVILPSHTYIATAAAVHLVGATPVLAECGSDHMLDVNDAEQRITSKTRAIMPVQINGRTCDMDAVGSLAQKYNLIICEDAAQALGSQFKGQSAGTFGSFGTISFYPAKLLGCFGDGGAIITNDDALAQKVFLLRDHGRDESGKVIAWGYNSRLDNLQAAILDFKLKSFPKDIERRRVVAGHYHQGLSDIKDLTLPPHPDADVRHFDVYQNYELEANRRDDLRAYLSERGVGTIIQWAGTPVHQFESLEFDIDLPKTDAFFKSCLMLPMNVALSDGDVSYVIESVREFYEK
jgi:dTDP-4-amino-4,6-dideoxygalactose transaminase